jgi:tetratricopeptide (TPR) repeat protein
MVLNTYNAILRLDPEDPRAIDELAAKYRAMGRWQDLIGVLAKKAELTQLPVAERAAILRETAGLWVERFGNYAQAIRPLERLLELDPADAEALAQLKDIYTRRRQWRQLITLLGIEAEALIGDERRAKRHEMARLAAERVGDTRLAIEIHNQTLAEAGVAIGGAPVADGLDETYAALAALYEREKRYPALAEILGRQRARAATPAEAIALLEKQGALLADRMGAPALAAEAFAAILALEPHHAKALRTLRELYAAAGDWDGLERLYGGLGQWDELVDALIGLGDRQDDRDARLALVRRAARVASARQEPEKAARVWEKVLAIDPTDATAARALVPTYQKSDKPAKLLPVYEVLLAHCHTTVERLAQMAEIRALCEQRLGSRALALAWTVRAFELAPDDPALAAELTRLAQVPEHWREVAHALERVVGDPERPADLRLRHLRTLAMIHGDKLDDDAAARDAYQRIRALAPADDDAEAAIERLSEQLSDWPELLASYRRSAARATGAARRQLLGRIAQVEEERLADLDLAVVTHQLILAEHPGDDAALAALARLHEARGDWDGLATVLAAQAAAASGTERAALELRLAGLTDDSLERPADAPAALPRGAGRADAAAGEPDRGLRALPAGRAARQGDRRRRAPRAGRRARAAPGAGRRAGAAAGVPGVPGRRPRAGPGRGARARSPAGAAVPGDRPAGPGVGAGGAGGGERARRRRGARRADRAGRGAGAPARAGGDPRRRAGGAAPGPGAGRRGPRDGGRAGPPRGRRSGDRRRRREGVDDGARARRHRRRGLRGAGDVVPRRLALGRPARAARAAGGGGGRGGRQAGGADRADHARRGGARRSRTRGHRLPPHPRARAGPPAGLQGARAAVRRGRELGRARRGARRRAGVGAGRRAGGAALPARRAARAAPRRSPGRGRAARGGGRGAAGPRRRPRAARGAARRARAAAARGAHPRAAVPARQAVEGPDRRAADPGQRRGRRRGRAAARPGRRHRGARAGSGPRRVRHLGPGPGGGPGRDRAARGDLAPGRDLRSLARRRQRVRRGGHRGGRRSGGGGAAAPARRRDQRSLAGRQPARDRRVPGADRARPGRRRARRAGAGGAGAAARGGGAVGGAARRRGTAGRGRRAAPGRAPGPGRRARRAAPRRSRSRDRHLARRAGRGAGARGRAGQPRAPVPGPRSLARLRRAAAPQDRARRRRRRPRWPSCAAWPRSTR